MSKTTEERIKELEEALKKAIDIAESWIKDQLEGTSYYDEGMAEINNLLAILNRK